MGCFDDIKGFRESKRYLNKDTTTGVRDMYSTIWTEYINMYGVQTSFYRHGYVVDTQDDFIYGEDPTTPYHKPLTINMVVDYQSDSLLLSKFGIESLADLSVVVSIEDFQNTFGIHKEPKPHDVIELSEAAWLVSEMPVWEGMDNYLNVVQDLAVSGIEPVSATLGTEILIPVKGTPTEQKLSYIVDMYTTTDVVTGASYPIQNELLIPSGGDFISGWHIQLELESGTYFTPVGVPSGDYYLPGVNSLYFRYDIVDIQGEPLSAAGSIAFDYIGEHLLMPVYTYATSGVHLDPIIIHDASEDVLDFDGKSLLCKHQESDKVASIMMDLSGVYGYKYVRYPQMFEITEVKYQDLSQQGINFAQGHYVWLINAKRFDYSFEPGISSEGPMKKVYDNSFFGTLSTFNNEPSPDKVYDEDVDDAGDEVWDYKKKGTNTDPYGYY